MKTAVIGVGNMGSKYAYMIHAGMIPGMELSALTRVKGAAAVLLKKALEAGVPVYETADDLFEAVKTGELRIEAVIIAVPHYDHATIALKAFEYGLHVLSDKPAGVYSRQARMMSEAADKAGCVFGMIFQQRALPVYQRLKEIIESGQYGALKRLSWTVTDWYRPDSYYAGGKWRASWKGEGGGVLVNQCPHNLDLLQWIFGMPSKVQAFCHEGRYHPVEVEDDVTAYLEWDNGATGTFVTSTGEAPGVNRLEAALEEALVICENGTLRIAELKEELGCPEKEYRKNAQEAFRRIKGTWKEESFEPVQNPHRDVLVNFVKAVLQNGSNTAEGKEGRKSLTLSNAMYLSSWEKKMVKIPAADSDEEKAFEREFETHLAQKGGRIVI